MKNERIVKMFLNILPYRYQTALKSRWLLRLNRKLIYRMITTTERWSWINPLQVIIVPVHRSSIRKRSTLIFGLYNTRCSSRQSSQPWAPIFSSWTLGIRFSRNHLLKYCFKIGCCPISGTSSKTKPLSQKLWRVKQECLIYEFLNLIY